MSRLNIYFAIITRSLKSSKYCRAVELQTSLNTIVNVSVIRLRFRKINKVFVSASTLANVPEWNETNDYNPNRIVEIKFRFRSISKRNPYTQRIRLYADLREIVLNLKRRSSGDFSANRATSTSAFGTASIRQKKHPENRLQVSLISST